MTTLVISAFASQAIGQQTTAQQIEQLQKQLDELKLQVGTTGSQPAVSSPTSPPPMYDSAKLTGPSAPTAAQSSSIASSMSAPAPKLDASKADVPKKPDEKKYPDFKMTGVFQLDSAIFAQSAASQATLGDIEDGTGFRRARLAAAGNVSERGSYLMEFDLAQAQARFIDVWGQVNDTPLGNMRIGRFRQPFGMTELTSVRELPTLERPTIFALSPFRQTGIMFSDVAPNERLTYAFSGFRSISDNFGNVYGDDGGYGTAERITTLLRDDGDDCGVTHLGFDHSFMNPARNEMLIASQDEIFIGQQPNLGPTGLSVFPIVNVPPFVNSGLFNVNHSNSYNLEGAISRGNKLIQSEYRWTNLDLPIGDNVTVHGGYVTMRYVLTGETIPYNRAAGVFGRVKPHRPLDIANGSYGAWELIAQISSLNLNPLFGAAGVPGPTRRLESGTVGLNWYWWDNAKCQFEWINGSLNDPALGDSVSNTLAARFQMDF